MLGTDVFKYLRLAVSENEELRDQLPSWAWTQEEVDKKWRSEPFESLTKEFSETRLLRLAKIRPEKICSAIEAIRVLIDLVKLRYFMFDCSGEGISGFKKGWNNTSRVQTREGNHMAFYNATTSRIAKYEVLIEDLQERVSQLVTEEGQAAEALNRSKEACKQLAKTDQDVELISALWHALNTSPPAVGFVYFKRWTMPDGSCWYKIGISNNPDRRETEQNVLPVAAETITCINVGSMDRARVIEAVIHQVLAEQRITDANNRELFHLSNQQASAVKTVLEKLE